MDDRTSRVDVLWLTMNELYEEEPTIRKMIFPVLQSTFSFINGMYLTIKCSVLVFAIFGKKRVARGEIWRTRSWGK
jgi:hypothetical protein